jgi:MFS family permease
MSASLQESAAAPIDAPPVASEPPYPRPAYARYVLGVLTLVSIFSFLDRQVLNLLVGPIRKDLHISDTQISLLIGIAFAAFYVTLGIPLGRIADSRSRRGLIAVGFALWSVFSAGCGLVSSYAQLGLMRMGVGVGEASLSPAAYSLITDYFPSKARGVAQGVYSAGIYVGTGLAFILGGLITAWSAHRPVQTLPLIGTVHSWQLVFFIIGGTGFCLVPLMLTVKEPVRRGVGSAVRSMPLSEVFAYFKQHWRTFACHNAGIALLTFSANGAAAWIPAYFIRHFHWTIAHTGLVYGGTVAVFGALGTCCAGWLADRLAARGQRDACMYVACLVALVWLPFGIGVLLFPNAAIAAVLLAPSAFFSSGIYSVGPAALMQITPPRMRGQAGAFYLFVISIVGLGLGPTAVAVCTDYLFHDDAMVGYSLLIVTVTAHVLAAALFWYGRKPFVQSQAAVLPLATPQPA